MPCQCPNVFSCFVFIAGQTHERHVNPHHTQRRPCGNAQVRGWVGGVGGGGGLTRMRMPAYAGKPGGSRALAFHLPQVPLPPKLPLPISGSADS